MLQDKFHFDKINTNGNKNPQIISTFTLHRNTDRMKKFLSTANTGNWITHGVF